MTVLRFRLFCLIAALSLVGLPAHAADGYYDGSEGGSFNSSGTPSRPQAPGSAYPGSVSKGGQQSGPGYGELRTPSITNAPGNDRRVLRPELQFPQLNPFRRPAKPNEFQKFVESATGRLLPIFGASFFTDPSATFNQIDNVPVTADYLVGPGDEVIVRAWGSIDVDYRTTVDRNGMLNLPKIGSFNVAGVRAADLEKNLRAQIGRLYTNFNLSVALGQLRAVKVFVVGPARRPGVYTLPSQSTLLSALVAAGGPAPNGSMRRIALRRNGTIVSELDMYQFLVQGDKSKDLQLAPGDVVVLQPTGPQVALTGAIDTPAIYELKSTEEPLREVLRYAGGAPVLANPHKVQLERIDPSQPTAARYVEEFGLDASGLQKPLRDGDVLTLLEISPQFANAVTLKGHVAQPLRYPWKPGMRIRDLIPDRDALISPDFYRRKNLLVQIIEDNDRDRHDRYGRDDRSQIGSERDRNGDRLTADSNDRNDARDRNPPPDRAGGYPPGSYEAAAARLAGDYPDSDRSRDRSGRYDRRNDRERGGIGESIARGERLGAARGPKAPTTLFDELNWDYAVIERLNRKDLSTEVIPFNLGKAILQDDPANNIALLPGDVVTIFSQKDVKVPVARQTRLVSLEGEINAPGVYQLLPGETLRGLVARAGGFTPQAYVYGLEFTREATRERQRENLATAMARLQSLAAVQSARDAANRRDEPAGVATSVAVSNAATQAQLARLSRIVPNGRVALELTPDTRTLDQLPDLPLENADRISVPPRPGFVTVAGAVVNSNAFVWKPGRTAGEYLALAGADEAADPSNMFILRADGTVTKAGEKRGWFSRGGLEQQVMQPGDALIVPTQLDFETWGRALVRNLKDFSQIFSGFGIGIAAIHSLNN